MTAVTRSALLRSEWRKTTTVRTPLVLLLVAVAYTLVNAGASSIAVPDEVAAELGIPSLATAEGVRNAFAGAGAGYLFALLLGVLLMTAEFRHGQGVATFLATPRRERVVAAKMAVAAAWGAGLQLVSTLLGFALVGVVLAVKEGTAPVEPGVLGQILAGSVLAGAALAVLGVGWGALLRNQVLALVSVLVWVLLVEALVVAFLPEVGRWLPGGAVTALLQASSLTGGGYLPVPAAAGLLLGYAAVFAGIATVTTLRRDV